MTDKFNKYIWAASKTGIVTVNGLEKRFVFVGILHDEVLGNGSTTATSNNFLLDENIFISVSSAEIRFKGFLTAFEVLNTQAKKATDTQTPFFDNLTLLG